MAPKKTLNAENLEALGATRLAALLIEISEGNATAKRRLRLELVGTGSPTELVKEIRKRLATIGRSRSFVDWQKRKALIDDLESQRKAILDHVAKRAPADGLDLMWRFPDLAKSIYERSDDGSGSITAVFDVALSNLGAIALDARPDPAQLADQTFAALNRNGYGQFDGLIPTLAPVLGPAGLEHLKRRVAALSSERTKKPEDGDRKVIGWAIGKGPIYGDDIEERRHAHLIQSALQDIADAQGDVDAYIAQYNDETRKAPRVAAEIAVRLLKADRAKEAWRAIEATEHRKGGWIDFDWEDARVAVLEALGRNDDAQEARWSVFERSLSKRHLRDYLNKLPDFDDFEAEQRALDHAERADSPLRAIAFLIDWPALDRAARVVMREATDLDGNSYEYLTSAAEALAGKYPLAATLALRAMIDFTLINARATRYGHAARHLRDCAGLATAIKDYGTFETHDAFWHAYGRKMHASLLSWP